MTKKLYLYERIDQCTTDSDFYHKEGGLVVITSGYPNDAVRRGIGNRFTVGRNGLEEERWGLPEADLVIVVPDETPDNVIIFPDSGCC